MVNKESSTVIPRFTSELVPKKGDIKLLLHVTVNGLLSFLGLREY